MHVDMAVQNKRKRKYWAVWPLTWEFNKISMAVERRDRVVTHVSQPWSSVVVKEAQVNSDSDLYFCHLQILWGVKVNSP